MGRKMKLVKDAHIQKAVYFSKVHEVKMLDWLTSKKNQSAYIKALIRADMDLEKYRRAPGQPCECSEDQQV